jgi:lipoic acid synthetase
MLARKKREKFNHLRGFFCPAPQKASKRLQGPKEAPKKTQKSVRKKLDEKSDSKEARKPMRPVRKSPKSYPRPPEWITRGSPFQSSVHALKEKLRKASLVTVCEEAKCPNIGHCFSRPTATFMVLGETCTRHCSFCAVDGQTFRKETTPPDPSEPQNLVQSIEALGLQHVVITMVTRDDLPDGGAHHLARCVETIREELPAVKVEVLTSDFNGKEKDIAIAADSKPHIFNHNVETVERLQMRIRHKSSYERTLRVLEYAKERQPKMKSKSGLMLGFGEKYEEVVQTLKDLRNVGCEMLTIGQYLPPTRLHTELKEYVHPSVFKELEKEAKALGFTHAFCGPMVRSSYMADAQLEL